MIKINELRRQFQRKPSFIHSHYLVVIILLNISIISGQQRTYVKSPFLQQVPTEENAQIIEPGKLIKRELSGGQKHDYLIAVSPGAYLNLIVSQLGVDVVLTIYRKSGEKVIEVDKANGTRGRESISLILDTTGDYHLQVRAREERSEAGYYTLEITEARSPTTQDETRWSAEQNLALAKQLLRQDTAEALSQAIEKYFEALRLWRAANDAEGESITLLSLANAYFNSGKYQQALEHYKEAAVSFQSINDPDNKALAVLYVGMCKLSLGDSETALANYEEARDLFGKSDDQKYFAFALNEMGRVYYLQGSGPQARDYFLRAIEIRKRVDDRKGLAFSLTSVGRVLFYVLGEDEQAIDYYRQALEIQQEIKDHRRAAQTLDDIGRINFSSGRYSEALDHYDRAIKLQRDSGDTVGEAETLSYIGMVYTASGRYDEALDHHRRALKIQQDAGDRVGEGRTLHNMGMAYFVAGNDEQALVHLNAALKIWRDVLFRTAEAETRYVIARVENRRGNFVEARRQIEEALPIVESLRTKIANQYLRISYFASVHKYYELYIDILMRMHEKSPAAGLDKLALSVSERARARSLIDTLVEAHTNIRQGVDPDLLKQEQNLQRELTSLSQQRMLRDPQNMAQKATAGQRLASLLADYQRVEEQIVQKSPGYAALTQPVMLKVEDIQTKLLDRDTVLLEYALGDERSYLWAVTQTSITKYELPKSAEIENTAKHLREALTARNRKIINETFEQTTARMQQADADIFKTSVVLSEMLSLGKAVAQSNAKRLLIVADGELQYIPFSLLPLAPRANAKGSERAAQATGFSNGSVPLVTYYEVAMLSSASLLMELRREQAEPAKHASQKRVIVLADPVFDKDDERVRGASVPGAAKKPETKASGRGTASTQPASLTSPIAAATRETNVTDAFEHIARLPFTRREADSIVNLLSPPNGMKVLDFDASRNTVNSGLLAQFSIVHFATHGFTNDEHPELSGILLSMVNKKGEAQDGFLQLHEIYNLNLPVDMVVLSACETGVGKKVRGEGLISLTRGFMYAGAKRVIASLWQVNDPSTARFMKYFYQAIKDGMSPASALRAAQLEMLNQPLRQSPYYWAAFVLQGEWQTLP
jgi:CHAT domain-containing protein/tetratricopeptide (TPR) repeat protein